MTNCIMSSRGKLKNTLEHLIFNLDHMMLKSHKTEFLLSEQLTSPDPTLDNANWSIFGIEKTPENTKFNNVQSSTCK